MDPNMKQHEQLLKDAYTKYCQKDRNGAPVPMTYDEWLFAIEWRMFRDTVRKRSLN
jgi:hypothetical protein